MDNEQQPANTNAPAPSAQEILANLDNQKNTAPLQESAYQPPLGAIPVSMNAPNPTLMNAPTTTSMDASMDAPMNTPAVTPIAMPISMPSAMPSATPSGTPYQPSSGSSKILDRLKASRTQLIVAGAVVVVILVIVGATAIPNFSKQSRQSSSGTRQGADLSTGEPIDDTPDDNITTSDTADTTDATASNPQNSSSEAGNETPAVGNETNQNQVTTGGRKNSCGVASIDQEICDTFLSLEKSGLNNNPLVTADIREVSDSARVTIDKSSWIATGNTDGSVKFSAISEGKNYQGIGFMRKINGTWKVIDYDIDD